MWKDYQNKDVLCICCLQLTCAINVFGTSLDITFFSYFNELVTTLPSIIKVYFLIVCTHKSVLYVKVWTVDFLVKTNPHSHKILLV